MTRTRQADQPNAPPVQYFTSSSRPRFISSFQPVVNSCSHSSRREKRARLVTKKCRDKEFIEAYNNFALEGPMDSRSEPDVTVMLRAWMNGDRDALERLISIVYPELRRIAQRYMGRERTDHTLQASALVNEAYLRLNNLQRIDWQDRAHFFAVSAELMRRVLVDHARSRGFQKRGGGAEHVPLEDLSSNEQLRMDELLDLDQALTQLANVDQRKARVVELRCFGGLSADEVAAVLGVSPETVHRDWKLSRAWLTRQMTRQRRI